MKKSNDNVISNDKLQAFYEAKKAIEDIMANSKNQTITPRVEQPSEPNLFDVTGQNEKITGKPKLTNYIFEVPIWNDFRATCFSDINNTNYEVQGFYHKFSKAFFKGLHYDVGDNHNYVIVLIYEIISNHVNDSDSESLKNDFDYLTDLYPFISDLCKKELDNFEERLLSRPTEPPLFSMAKAKSGKFEPPNIKKMIYTASAGYSFKNSLGFKMGAVLNLSDKERELLDELSYPNNFFCNIDFCLTEVVKLFLFSISKLKTQFIDENTSLKSIISEIIKKAYADKRAWNQSVIINEYLNAKYLKTILDCMFRECENKVRKVYCIKRTMPTKMDFLSEGASLLYKNNILDRLNLIFDEYEPQIAKPTLNTEITLNQNINGRWILKHEQIILESGDNYSKYIDEVVKLSEQYYTSYEPGNLFSAAIKYLFKQEPNSALILIIHFSIFLIKNYRNDADEVLKLTQVTKFESKEEHLKFSAIIQKLFKKRDIPWAFEAIKEIKMRTTGAGKKSKKGKIAEQSSPKIRKTIKLDKASILQAQEKHIDTVEILNEYLRDDEEGDRAIEVKPEISTIAEPPIENRFLAELNLSKTQIELLELFSRNKFVILQSEMDKFAKSRKLFKNGLVDSVNELCFDVLDDNLIEEEDDKFTINEIYYNKLK